MLKCCRFIQGGTKGTVRSKFLLNDLRSLLVNSLFLVFFFSRLSWSEQPPRGPIIMFCCYQQARAVNNEHHYFFLSYVVQLVQFYCIKNRLFCSRVETHIGREREIRRTIKITKRKNNKKKDISGERIEQENQEYFKEILIRASFRISRHFKRSPSRSWRDFRITHKPFHYFTLLYFYFILSILVESDLLL